MDVITGGIYQKTVRDAIIQQKAETIEELIEAATLVESSTGQNRFPHKNFHGMQEHRITQLTRMLQHVMDILVHGTVRVSDCVIDVENAHIPQVHAGLKS